MAQRPAADSGLIVVFVIAGDVKQTRTDARPAVYKFLEEAILKVEYGKRARVAQQIGIVCWTELFPGPHLVSADFFTLRVDRPTGRRSDLWESADVLDPNQVPGPSDRARPVLLRCQENLPWMGQSPHWYRTPALAARLEPGHWAADILIPGRRWNPAMAQGRRKPPAIDAAFPLGLLKLADDN